MTRDPRGHVTRYRSRDRVISPVMALALLGVLTVVLCGDVWSFREQTDLARTLDFDVPQLLPIVLDGLAASLAAVAFAASLDGRPAIGARLGTGLAIAASSGSNLAAAALRMGAETASDRVALAIAAGIPVAANLAWEVILGEMRRQVMRRRGMPAPVPVPWPRVIRIILAPISTIRVWRGIVLGLTDPAKGHSPVTPVTPQVTVTDRSRDHKGHDLLTPHVTPDPVTRDPHDPQGHVTPGPVTGHDPSDPPARDRVVTPMTQRSTDIDPWVTQAMTLGVTRSAIIRSAMSGDPLGDAGAIPRVVSESTAKRAIRRCSATKEKTA